jgi:cysteinyl-tRNA synthetase
MLPNWPAEPIRTAIAAALLAVILPAAASAQTNTDNDAKVLPGKMEALKGINFRDELRSLVMDISKRGREGTRKFFIVTEGGEDLVLRRPLPDRPRDDDGIPLPTLIGEPERPQLSKILLENVETHRPYLRAIDAQSFDGLFYGYSESGTPTPEEVTTRRLLFTERIQQLRLPVWTADLIDNQEQADAFYNRAESLDIIGFANDSGSGFFDAIPEYPKRIPNANSNNIDSISKVRNFIKLTDSSTFESKQQFIFEMQQTNYDAIVVDVFHGRGNPLDFDEVEALKYKRLGATRLVLAKVDVSRISDQAYFWKDEWSESLPPWIFDTSNDGIHLDIMFWSPEWREILFGRKDSYIGGIYLLGFDGIYLTGLDAYERYEEYLYRSRVQDQ